MQLQFSHKTIQLLAILSGLSFLTGCAVTTNAVRPSFSNESRVTTVVKSTSTAPAKQPAASSKEKCKTGPFCERSSGLELPDSTDGMADERRYNSEFYAYSQASSPVIRQAAQYLGAGYRSGGVGPNGFDCSGYVWRVYSDAGYQLNRGSSGDYFVKGDKVERDEAQPGDMVFFRERGRINHVGIFVGGDKFIHSSSGRGVIESSMEDNYWRPRLAGFRRFGS